MSRKMAHWIDNADSYICPVCRYEVNNQNTFHGRCPRCGFMDTKDVRSADVVEVVRCKDCVFCHYNSSNETYKCSTMNGMYRTVEPNEFCSYGERKDND